MGALVGSDVDVDVSRGRDAAVSPPVQPGSSAGSVVEREDVYVLWMDLYDTSAFTGP